MIQETNTQPGENRLRSHLLRFVDDLAGAMRGGSRFIGSAGLQDFRTGRAFGILQITVLRHNQSPPQRNHHQNSEQPAQQRHEHHARDFEIQTKNHDRRHRHAHAEGDRHARGPCGLNDVVFEDRRVTQTDFGKETKQGDRNDRHRN